MKTFIKTIFFATIILLFATCKKQDIIVEPLDTWNMSFILLDSTGNEIVLSIPPYNH